jgi:hypothetical protein
MGTPTSLGEDLTVKAAAELLGIWQSTLAKPIGAGKLKPHRHPMN